MTDNRDKLPKKTAPSAVDAFLRKVAQTPLIKPAGGRGRLIFALDATASREPSWDRASHLQARMFEETAALGGLDVQLVYYRGHEEFYASPWHGSTDALLRRMTGVRCLAGLTQIGAVLRHAIDESRHQRVQALVFIGDCVEEDIDRLGHLAGELGVLGVPAFVFQDGQDRLAASAFAQIARLSGGAYLHLDADSARQLGELLRAVAVYAAGGSQALLEFSARSGSDLVHRLTHQLKR